MKEMLLLTAVAGCMVFNTGCCKGVRAHEQTESVKVADVVVDNTAQPHKPVSTEQSAVPTLADQPHEEMKEVETSVVATAADANRSVMAWLAFSAMTVFIGWLAYKFIFRKR